MKNGRLHLDSAKVRAFNDPLDERLSGYSTYQIFMRDSVCKDYDRLPFMDRVCPLLEQRGVKMTVSKAETTIYSPYWPKGERE